MTADPSERGASRSSDRGALRRCVGVDPDLFAAEHWGRRPLLTAAADLPGPFGDLFDLAQADELLSRRGLRTPFLRVARDGSVLGSSQFTRGGGVGAEISDQVADDRVAALFAEGSTLVLQGLHRLWPPLIDFATDLGADLGHPVQVNAYLTPPQSQGFSAHYDVHDVFVLQVAGRKRWRVHEPVHQDPLRDQPWADHADAVAERANQAPLIDEVLAPGDALYLPRGYLHSAVAEGGISAHLTVGVHVVTRYALVEALLALVGRDVDLRASLPLGLDVADPERLAPHVADVVKLLGSALADADPSDVADRVRRRVWSGNLPRPLAPLAQATAAREAAEEDAVRWRPGLRFRLSTEGDRVVLDLPHDRMTLPARTAAALDLLAEGGVVRIGDLPGLPAEDQRVLARRLLKEGVLVPA
ncbi:cupin domain-containing protein [Umezawaea endophytica]|uniref:Cupin domain-containing protein n=1 Tax=Umezawaea endophytica TaxID=1654476 RepID=A0A9X2VGD7_9PSEU|nr:cupin domain-containing protein [Umezawaea endophytica]MCS7475612.1 cupin domain-containing protein [Umezawaea endophytica]